MNLALIDLGSNSARMYLIDFKDDGSYEYIAKYRVMTRLSEGMGEDKTLKEIPMTRTIAVLKDFAEKIKDSNSQVIAIATAAVRKAVNGVEFCNRVKAETGIKLKVISGEKEAQLDFKGVMSGLPLMSDCMITDTGGGSTEIILVKSRKIEGKISFPFGAMSLTEQFGNDFEKARAFILTETEKSGFIKSAKKVPIVGIGGSICSTWGIDLALFPKSDIAEVHGYTIKPERLKEIFDKLSIMTPTQRMEKAGVEKGRADTVCAGILPTLTLTELIDAPSVTLCTSGLREGILAEIKEKNTIEIL